MKSRTTRLVGEIVGEYFTHFNEERFFKAIYSFPIFKNEGFYTEKSTTAKVGGLVTGWEKAFVTSSTAKDQCIGCSRNVC